MNPEQAKGALQFFLATMDNEFGITKKVIAAVPQDKCEWRPDRKAKTALELAWHVPTAEIMFLDGIIAGAFTMPDSEPAPPGTIADVLAFYEKSHTDRVAKLKALSGEQLAKTVILVPGVLELPAVMYLNLLILHTAHHRGQLSVYLRPMGSKVPSIYGGSADEPFEMSARA